MTPEESQARLDNARASLQPLFDFDDLIMSATAYYLGRRTISVDTHCRGIVKAWPALPQHVRDYIQRTVEGGFRRDDYSRSIHLEIRPLGDDCDRASWETVRALWQQAPEGRPDYVDAGSPRMLRYDVRCFRRRDKGKIRHGVWVMTRKTGCRGLFVHGDYDEIHAPQYSVEALAESQGDFVDEITPDDVLKELASWPAAVEEVQRCFDRHPASDNQ